MRWVIEKGWRVEEKLVGNILLVNIFSPTASADDVEPINHRERIDNL
jgi:hypothetical protein